MVPSQDRIIRFRQRFIIPITPSTIDFTIGTQEWNRGAVKIPALKPINKIDVSLTFQGNYTGSVWFDAVRLMEGSIVTKKTYDPAGNYVVKEEDEVGNTIFNVYDGAGNLKEETDAKGAKKVYTYNLSDQLAQLLLSNGTKIGYQYDKNGNMTSKSITDSSGTAQSFSYLYDVTGKLKETKGPLNDIILNEYDANGNKLKTVLPKGNYSEWVYDGTERVSGISYNSEPYYTFGYDKNGNELSVQYVKENRSKSRTFDSSNRLRTLTDRVGSQQWEYPSESDKLKTFTFSQGPFSHTNTFEYNQLDQNTVVKDGTNTYRFEYDERGNVRTFTTGNGAGTTFNNDDRGLVENLAAGTTDGTEILSEKYSYDQNGNRTKIEYPDGSSISYEYGDLDQLTKEILRDGTIQEYSYDGFGNRKSIQVTKEGKTTTTSAQYNIANQLTQFGNETITYDANGNRLSDGQYKYEWNAADQLISVTKQGETTPFVTYQYNEDGKRIQKNVNGTITNYFYDGDSLNVLYEIDGQNNVVLSYTYSENCQLLSMRKGTPTYFYHYNAHGDVIAITDQNGQKVASYEYDSWGNVLKAEEAEQVKDNPYRYAGYQFDRETGLYYLIARYYQPKQGVFLSLDPDPGDSDDIITQNGYAYGNNNPVMMVDPDGQYIQFVIMDGVAVYRGYKVYKVYKTAKKVSKVAKTVNKIHGNSKKSKKVQHGYEIYDKENRGCS